jgi:hypothetical protein
MRRVKLLVLAMFTVVTLALSTVPVGAQEWSQWFYHPNSGNYWYCTYYGTEFWCNTESGTWIRANNPGHMQLDGWIPV